MPGEQAQSQLPSYPSPSAAQVSAAAGPFYSQNGSSDQAQIPHDLQQLQNAEIPSRAVAANGSSAGSGGAAGVADMTGHHQHPQQYHTANHHTDAIHASTHTVDEPDGRLPTHQQSPTSPQSLAQGVLNMSEDHHDASVRFQQTPDSTRKRSKTSRACDECRRKKIRCDASEVENETCSNCKRTSARCQFSRQPMKRGPSKGYIKELADRLNTLENQLGPSHGGSSSDLHHYMQNLPDESITHHGQDFSTPSTVLQSSRKRTHSMSENASFSASRDHPYSPAGRPWPSETNARTYQSASNAYDSLSTSANLFKQPLSPTSIARQGPPDRFRLGERTSSPPDAERDAEAASFVELDDRIIDEYYRIIHQTFPLLPHSKTRLRVRLGKCSTTLRNAFLAALECAIRSAPAANVPLDSDLTASVKRAAELIAASQYENVSNRGVSSSLVYIQTLILMALESDNHGPATMRGQVGPPRAEWLGRAIGMATHLKLNIIWSRTEFAESDADSDLKLGRRVWWILFILDRWHASSTSSLLQLPDTSSSLVPEDQLVLGEAPFHLARLSYILGHVSSILQQPPSLMAPGSTAGPIISTTILGEIERFRESVESVLLGAPNLVHLCYWHVRLLILRLTASTTPHELLTPATRMASILNSSHTMLTPLNHHFAALAALTLVELSEFPETRRLAEKGIEDIVEAISARKGLLSGDNSVGWDSAIKELAVSRKKQFSAPATSTNAPSVESTTERAVDAGLRHLADAAIGGKPRSQTSGASSSGAGSSGHTDTLNNNATGNNGVGNENGTSTLGLTPASTTAEAENPLMSDKGLYDPTMLTRYGYLAALV